MALSGERAFARWRQVATRRDSDSPGVVSAVPDGNHLEVQSGKIGQGSESVPPHGTPDGGKAPAHLSSIILPSGPHVPRSLILIRW